LKKKILNNKTPVKDRETNLGNFSNPIGANLEKRTDFTNS